MPRLEHVGIAIEDAGAVLKLYEQLLGLFSYKEEVVAREGVQTHFLSAGSAKLELLEATAPGTAVARFLERRGEGLHHLAFEVPDAEDAMARARASGFTPLSEAPYAGADGKRIFFLHPRDTHGVLIECCQQTPVPLEPELIPHEGGRLAVYTLGKKDRPPLLMLHGAAGCTQLEAAALARRMSRCFRVVALDFSGHGASDDLGVPFSTALFTDNARAALDHVGLERANVFGFSMGGYMALHFARLHPERVRRLAVHGTCARWDAALVDAMNARLNAGALATSKARAAERLRALHADWKMLFVRTADFVRTLPGRSAEMEAAVAHIQTPTLVSAVDRDDLFPLSTTLHLHQLLPQSRLALLPDAHHALQRLNLDLYAPLLARHLASRAE